MYSSRKPYHNLKLSPREFFGLPTRYLRDSATRESQFEKPYRQESYPEMHTFPPIPGIDTPTFDVGGGGGGGGGQLIRGAFCSISCRGGRDCTDPYHCTVSGRAMLRWVGTGPSPWALDPELLDQYLSEVRSAVLIKYVEISGIYGTVAGSDERFTIYPPEDDWPDQVLTITVTQPWGNMCIEVLTTEVCADDCCESEEYVAVTWDRTNSIETLAREASGSIYVLDGCGPYTWSVSGTGFTLTFAETEIGANTLSASALACGTATITVTDFCANSVTGYVRCTEGQWVEDTDYRDGPCPSNVSGCGEYLGYHTGTTTHRYELIKDNWKYEQATAIGQFLGSAEPLPCSGVQTCIDLYEAANRKNCIDCDHDFPCQQLTETSVRCYWRNDAYNINRYYEWEC